jgi:hypothetical protein
MDSALDPERALAAGLNSGAGDFSSLEDEDSQLARAILDPDAPAPVDPEPIDLDLSALSDEPEPAADNSAPPLSESDAELGSADLDLALKELNQEPEAISAFVPEDTNFDEPNEARFPSEGASQSARKAPDSSTAVIVNYLEDAEDSFFEVEGQASALSEDEDLDIDLLDQGAVARAFAAKPMVPVPRKAV